MEEILREERRDRCERKEEVKGRGYKEIEESTKKKFSFDI